MCVRENRDHGEGTAGVQYHMPLLRIHLKDGLFRCMGNHLDKERQGSLTRPISIKKVCKRAFHVIPHQCSPTAFKQGMEIQIISGWTVGGERFSHVNSHSVEPCGMSDLIVRSRGQALATIPRGMWCLVPGLSKERHDCHLVVERTQDTECCTQGPCSSPPPYKAL